jgi:hypothetical protein
VKPEKLTGHPGRKVYVVFNDFEDNASRNTGERVLEVAREAGVANQRKQKSGAGIKHRELPMEQVAKS